VEIIFTLF